MTDRLMPGQQLNVNQRLTSVNGRVILIMQADGNLVLYRADDHVALWSSNTWGKPATHAVMQTDGNFVIYDDAGTPYWSTNSWGRPGNWLVLQSDGNLVLYSSSNTPIWATDTVQNWPLPSDRLLPGQQLHTNEELVSANGKTRLTMQDDGNLVLYRTDNNVPLWASNTQGQPVTHAIMQDDGNFVLYDDAGKAYWATGDWESPGAWLIAQSDGNLVEYSSSNSPLWASNTVQNWAIITIPWQTANIGDGHYIQSDVDFDPSTNIATCHMHLTCTNHLFGFTAAAQLVFFGADGKQIGTALQQLGLGSDLFQTTHTDFTWTTQAPEGTQGIGLNQFWDPHGRIDINLGDLGMKLSNFLNDVGVVLAEAFDAPFEWCNQNPSDCQSVLVVLFIIGGTALCLLTGQCEVVITLIPAAG